VSEHGMTACQCRARLDRIDAIRSRVFKIAVAGVCGSIFLAETIRDPAGMAEALFWPGTVVAAILALHFAVEWLVRRRHARSG